MLVSRVEISDMRFQIALTSEHVADVGGVSFNELREYVAKKRKKERRKKNHGKIKVHRHGLERKIQHAHQAL